MVDLLSGRASCLGLEEVGNDSWGWMLSIPGLRRPKQENLALKASLGLYNEFKAIPELCRKKESKQ